MFRTMMAGALLTLGAGIALGQPAPAPASDNAATPAEPATPADPATPATPADPATGTAATPAEPADPATPATAATPADKDPLAPVEEAAINQKAKGKSATAKKSKQKMRCTDVNVSRPSKC